MQPLQSSATNAIKEAFEALGGVQRSAAICKWVSDHYPDQWSDVKLRIYLRGCSVNHPLAISYNPSFPRFLYNRAKGEFELYDEAKHGLFDEKGYQDGQAPEEIADLDEEAQASESSNQFALESHLRDYLAKNLFILEKGLELWSASPPSVEYLVSNRRIDLLARDSVGLPVVIELKLNKSYDRVIGQALLYRGLVAKQLGVKRVRIMLVAGEVIDELKIACSGLVDVQLFEYSISFQTKVVSTNIEDDN